MRRNRTAKGYDGTKSTVHQLKDVLPSVTRNIQGQHSRRNDLVLAAWPQIVGPRIAGMTEATHFFDGVLTVRVSNSTLHSLLVQTEKVRLLEQFKLRFPHNRIKDILFRIG